MINLRSGDLRPGRKKRFEKLPSEMQKRLGEFELGLHGVRENTKDVYLAKMEWFGSFLAEQGITQFEKVDKKDIDIFLSKYDNPNTRLKNELTKRRLAS